MIPALLALVLASSPTRLGVYVAGDDLTARTLLPINAATPCPAVAVFPLPGDTAVAQQVTALRSHCAGQTQIVFQVGGTGQSLASATASLSNDWFITWLQLVRNAGGTANDWVEGPTEMTAATDPAQVASYWSSFAADVVRSGLGLRPVVGGLAPGVPTTVATSDGGSENVFCQTLRSMAQQGVNWAWSYHARAATLPTSAQGDVFAYRTILSQCVANGAPTGVPLFLTQVGRTAGTWSVGDESWLSWFDAQVQTDVEGAALFEAGTTDRSLSTVATWLASYMTNPTSPDGGVPDGGHDGGIGGAPGGGIITGGPPANYPSSGCASAGAGVGLALAAVGALGLRRRQRQGLER